MIQWLLATKLGQALTGLLSALMLFLGVYHYGKRQARSEAHTEALEDYVDTKEKIDAVKPTDDRDVNLKRLQRTGRLRKGDM